MAQRVLITGMGIVSAIGNNLLETISSLRESRSGIGPLRQVKTRHQASVVVGEVKATNPQLKNFLGIVDQQVYTRTALLGMLAAKEAVQQAGISDITAFRTGLISATTVGGMDLVEDHYANFLNADAENSYPQYVDLLDSGDSTEAIADFLGISEHVSTISTACSSSANAILYGAKMIQHGLLDRVLVGGCDALSRFSINGFISLKILDPEPCRPFDAGRMGLNIGEGAGFLVLESEAAANGKPILAEWSGGGNANDAYHQTASSPEGKGAYLAIQSAFTSCGMDPSEIDYINAHGTGTELNDLSEGIALERIYGKAMPPISSTKAFTGHTLAAAGSIEAVFSILAIQQGWMYPNLRFAQPMPELAFRPITQLQLNMPVQKVLSNSFGFGGNTTSLIFSAYRP